MQINSLKLNRKKKKRKVVGRGGKQGTYSGRGVKGQKSRSGASVNPLFEGGRSTLIDHMKKKKGFTSKKIQPIAIDFSVLSKKFKKGDTISTKGLIEKDLLKKAEAKRGIKVIGLKDKKNHFTFDKEILLPKYVKKS